MLAICLIIFFILTMPLVVFTLFIGAFLVFTVGFFLYETGYENAAGVVTFIGFIVVIIIAFNI